MKRIFGGFRKPELFVLGIILIASAFTLGSSYVQTIGPFYRSAAGFNTLMAGQAGGRVVYARTGTDSLRVGQVVYWSDTNKVATSTTLAAYNTIAGVVVGGELTGMEAQTAITDTSDLATGVSSTGLAIVLTQGRTWVLNDANGAITIGQRIIPSNATAGRAEVITSAIDTNYRAIGKAVVGAASGTAILTDVNIH